MAGERLTGTSFTTTTAGASKHNCAPSGYLPYASSLSAVYTGLIATTFMGLYSLIAGFSVNRLLATLPVKKHPGDVEPLPAGATPAGPRLLSCGQKTCGDTIETQVILFTHISPPCETYHSTVTDTTGCLSPDKALAWFRQAQSGPSVPVVCSA